MVKEEDVRRVMADNRFGRVVGLWLASIPIPEYIAEQLKEARDLTGSDPAVPPRSMLEALQEMRSHVEVLVLYETNPKKLEESLDAIARSIQ